MTVKTSYSRKKLRNRNLIYIWMALLGSHEEIKMIIFWKRGDKLHQYQPQ